jgi:hypothetical protein
MIHPTPTGIRRRIWFCASVEVIGPAHESHASHLPQARKRMSWVEDYSTEGTLDISSETKQIA